MGVVKHWDEALKLAQSAGRTAEYAAWFAEFILEQHAAALVEVQTGSAVQVALQLTLVQARCTELLEEARALRQREYLGPGGPHVDTHGRRTEAQLGQAGLVLERLKGAVARAGFRLAVSLHDEPTLWCIECGQDSGFHYSRCSRGAPRAVAALEDLVAQLNANSVHYGPCIEFGERIRRHLDPLKERQSEARHRALVATVRRPVERARLDPTGTARGKTVLTAPVVGDNGWLGSAGMHVDTETGKRTALREPPRAPLALCALCRQPEHTEATWADCPATREGEEAGGIVPVEIDKMAALKDAASEWLKDRASEDGLGVFADTIALDDLTKLLALVDELAERRSQRVGHGG